MNSSPCLEVEQTPLLRGRVFAFLGSNHLGVCESKLVKTEATNDAEAKYEVLKTGTQRIIFKFGRKRLQLAGSRNRTCISGDAFEHRFVDVVV